MTRTVELALAHQSDIVISNGKVKRRVVESIKANFDIDKYRYPVGFATGKGVILTDGNHRVTALKEMGESMIPFVPLTKAEFDHVKFSKRHVDLNVIVPEKLKVLR